MIRDIILNFVCNNYYVLQEYNLKELQIIIYKKELKKYHQVFKTDDIFLYDTKFPLTKEKTISNSELLLPTLKHFSSLKEITIYKKEELSYPLENPYNNKDYSLSDFNYLMIIPIIKNELVVGDILFYINNMPSNKIDKGSITTLYNSICSYKENELDKVIELKLSNLDTKDYYIKKNGTILYQSKDTFNSIFEIGLDFPFEELILGYEKESVINILNIQQINNYIQDNDFTLLFFDLNNTDYSINDIINKLSLSDSIQIFGEQNCYFLLIKKELSKVLVKNLIKDFNCYKIAVTKNDGLNFHMDFIKIFKYLLSDEPLVFEYNKYEKYIMEYNSFKVDTLGSLNQYDIVNSFNNEQELLVNPLISKNYKNIDLDTFVKSISKQILKLNITNGLGISVTTSMLEKRHIINLIEKYNMKVFLHYDGVLSCENIAKILPILKMKSRKIVVDSKFFLNTELSELISFIDGVYFTEEEYVNLNNNEIIKTLIDYFLNVGKEIYLNNVKLNDYNHNLIYIIRKR